MAGFVYIFSNPLFSRIKIGKSTKDPTKDRLNELNRETGTPENYKCEYYVFVGDEHGLEMHMHKVFAAFRPQNNKEYFEVNILEAINRIRDEAPKFGGIKYEEIYYKDLKKISQPNGDLYEGTVKDGIWHGYGTYTHASGNKYVGEWKDGKKHGQGTFTWTNGIKYVGEYKDDKKHGQGTFTHANGDEYVGEWKDRNKHGQGTYTHANGNKYVGMWRDDKLVSK